MRAILLAAGFGTRLRPLTYTTPKCLVPIRGRPLLDIWLERLTVSGVGPFLINTHHLSSQVEKYSSQSLYAKKIYLSYESVLMGTAGTLRLNASFFKGSDGMLIHADNFCKADFKEFQIAHSKRPLGCLMTMMTFRSDEPSSCGIININANGVVTNYYEKTNEFNGNLANGAIYILSNKLIQMMSHEFKFANDFSTEVLPELVGKIFTYETKEALIDVGTPKNYMALVKE